MLSPVSTASDRAGKHTGIRLKTVRASP